MGLFSCFASPRIEESRQPPQRQSGVHKAADAHALASKHQSTPATAELSQKSSARLTPKLRPPPPGKDTRDPLGKHPSCCYRKIRSLNDGSSGFVQLAEEINTKQQVAIKFLERGSRAIIDADREICNLRLCCMHPFIIRFKEAFLTEDYLAIVSEYAPLGDLADYIDSERIETALYTRGLPEAQAQRLFQQMVMAVDFCHRKGIVNRDLKLENVLLLPPNKADSSSTLTAKLCDFGFSKDEAVDSICKTACGTPEYVAPEVLLQSSSNATGDSYSGRTADMWSLGVMLYVMLTGTYPFREASETWLPITAKLKAMFPRIVKGQFSKPDWVSPTCLNLLEGLLCTSPEKRLTVSNVMEHPWFLEGLASGATAVNSNLLQVSDLLLTSFVSQSEDQILSLVKAAWRKPGGSKSNSSGCPSLSLAPAQAAVQPQSRTSPTLASKSAPQTPAHMHGHGAQRWTLPAAHCADHLDGAMLHNQRVQFTPERPSLSSPPSHHSSPSYASSSGGASTVKPVSPAVSSTTSNLARACEEAAQGSSQGSFQYDDLIDDAIDSRCSSGASQSSQHSTGKANRKPPVAMPPSPRRPSDSKKAHSHFSKKHQHDPTPSSRQTQQQLSGNNSSRAEKVSPFSLVQPAKGMMTPGDVKVPAHVKLPPEIAANAGAPACTTPDLVMPRNVRQASATTSVGSLQAADSASSSFLGSSTDTPAATKAPVPAVKAARVVF
ncbi:hypothetical protein WJX73_004517 [Symbiochloris irregularis]|uniref:Protein kinase domain-containing protein n=1 Tax=Symbiochloris irregularis TaxID=706552 RepID=A0AAW1NSP4_9CHLO